MSNPNKYSFLLTPKFSKEAKFLMKKYSSFADDLKLALDNISENPMNGESLGRGCYKFRMAITSKKKGKSGGARIIINLKIEGKRIILLTIYDESVNDSISDKELTRLLKEFLYQ